MAQDLTDQFVEPENTRRLPSFLLILIVAIVLGTLLSFVVGFIQWTQTDQARWLYIGLDGMQWYLLYAGIGLIGGAGLVVIFKPRLRTVAAIGGTIATLVLGLSLCVRVESFRGDRTPRFVWRWTPTAEQEVKDYLVSHRARKVTLPTIPSEYFAATEHDFPGFQGPDRNAQLAGRNLSATWDTQPPRLLWKHPIGLGWSGFAIQGRVAVTMEQRDENECVVCYDLLSGEELWEHSEPVRFRSEHGDGPRTTPAIHGNRVFACGGTGVVTCLELSNGSLVWSSNPLADAKTAPPHFGWTCSPMLSGNELIVTPGIQPGGTMVALDVETGIERWRGGDDPTSYASPIASELCGRLQFLSFNGEGLRAIAPGGKPLWFQPWITQGESRVNVAQPVVVDRGGSASNERAKVLISSAYDMGTTLLEVYPEGKDWKVNTLWTSKHLKSKFSNCIVYRDYVWGLDNGLLTCLRLSDGVRTWKKGRYGHGQLLMVDGRLLIQCESGEIALVETNPESHTELARFRALEDKTWNHPSLAGNILVVRNDREAAAFELQTVNH